ncbi:PKD domain-containing protein [Nocardioides zhouii]|uniref:PKD domain-containing protein n=1 Tax=Nocardioides zhouii TaxID=1168729 RepID=A0A4Q2T918_9ACTN|nr:PKD domain-containing protein [Nocardioides zhouii]RYC13329.1 PKD domain-containing protein [Nocardioides zhouii]
MVRQNRLVAALTSLAFASTILVAAPAQAALTWQPVTDLSATGFTSGRVQVAVNAAGTSVTIWAFYDGTHYVVETATRPAGGTWSNAVLPRPDTLGTDFYAEAPQIALDEGGNATAVWLGSPGLQSATRSAGGAWTTPTTVAAIQPYNPRLAVDRAGNVTAIWARQEGGTTNRVIQTATRPAGGTWSAPVDLTATNRSSDLPQVALDPAGNATAVWAGSNGTHTIIQSSTRPVGGSWAPPIDLSVPGANAANPQVAIDAAGNAAALWTRPEGGSFLQNATRPAGGTWSAASYITTTGPLVSEPRIAFDAAGTLTAIWRGSDSVTSILQSATRSPAGTWSPSVNVSSTGQGASGQRLVVDPSGNATAVWITNEASDDLVTFATRSTGGGWSAPAALSAAGGDAFGPEIAPDPFGNAVAVWVRGAGSDQIAQARGLDGAGPLITAFTAPSSGVAGTSLAYGVAGIDVWSTLSAISWDFGDGATATGASTSHSFTRAGTYPVTVRLTDAVGNVTTRRTDVVVSAAPTTPTIPPKIKVFKLKPATIRASGSTSRTPARTKVTIVLTDAATVRLVFAGKTKAKLVKSLRAGKNTFKLSAKIGKVKLKPGTYKVRAVATNAGGRSAGMRVRLTVVR